MSKKEAATRPVPEAAQMNGQDMYPTEDTGANPLAAGDEADAQSDGGHTTEVHSETPTEKYERRVREAGAIWCCGVFCGASHLPKPKLVQISELDESVQDELLEEYSYTVPRGYTYVKENLPPILRQKPEGRLRTSLIAFIVLTSVSFALLLASACPIPWYKGKDVTVDGLNYRGVTFTLYRQKGGSLPEVPLRDLRTCPIEKQFYQGIAASIIMATVFSLLALVLAIVRVRGGKVGYGWIHIFGFFAFIWALCGNGMSMSQFHLSRCDKPRYPVVARLDAGFALSLIAWIAQLVAVVILTVTTKLNVGPSLRSIRVMDTWFFVLMSVALVCCVVGNASTIWKRHFGTTDVRVVRVTYWHTELIMGNGTNIIYGRAHYRCSAYNKRIKASVSFLILASVTIFLSVMLGIGAFVKRGCRFMAVTFGIISWAFLSVSWVTAVAVKYRTLCERSVKDTVYENYPGVPSGVYEGSTSFRSYGLAEGVALPIVAWIFVTAAVIANIAVPWPQVKQY